VAHCEFTEVVPSNSARRSANPDFSHPCCFSIVIRFGNQPFFLTTQREYSILDARKNDNMASSIRVTGMRTSLDLYIKMFGFRIIDKLARNEGKIVHAFVGFDSAVLMLSQVEYVREQEAKDNLVENKFGIGVEVHIVAAGS